MLLPLRTGIAVALLLLLAACAREAPVAPPAPAPPPPLPCDRACLGTLVDQFLAAMIARDPERIYPLPGFRHTENGVRLDAGDGLWRTLEAQDGWRLVVADEARGHVVFLGTVREAGEAAMLALHLTVYNRRPAAAEIVIHRDARAARAFASANWQWNAEVAEGARMPREALLRIANAYFDGLQRNDGQGDYPFAADCRRLQDGVQVRPGCLEEFRAGLLYHVSRIRDRRFVAVDEARGVAAAIAFQDHSAGDTRRFRTPDGKAMEAGPRVPTTLQLVQAFRIGGGQLREAITLSVPAPYGMNSGWSSWEEGLSTRLRDAAIAWQPAR